MARASTGRTAYVAMDGRATRLRCRCSLASVLTARCRPLGWRWLRALASRGTGGPRGARGCRAAAARARRRRQPAQRCTLQPLMLVLASFGPAAFPIWLCDARAPLVPLHSWVTRLCTWRRGTGTFGSRACSSSTGPVSTFLTMCGAHASRARRRKSTCALPVSNAQPTPFLSPSFPHFQENTTVRQLVEEDGVPEELRDAVRKVRCSRKKPVRDPRHPRLSHQLNPPPPGMSDGRRR